MFEEINRNCKRKEIMEKEFIPYQIAVDMKSIGFDEPCLGFYNIGGLFVSDYKVTKLQIDNLKLEKCCLAPTFSQANRFFIEKYNLYGTIRYGYNEFDKSVFLFPCINGISGNDSFETQEEAELECLKKLIEIVKEKNQ